MGESGATDETFKNIIKTPGDLYTRGLNCILVPFIFCSMITSVFNLRTLVNGNKIGKATVAFYVFTTLCAAILAASVSAMLIVPNVDTFDDSAVPDSAVSQGDAKISAYSDFQDDCGYDSEVWCKIRGTLENIVPNNIVSAMADSQLLGVMTFGVMVGLLIPDRGPSDDTSLIVTLANEVQVVMIKLMFVVIAFTPFAVMSLLSAIMLEYDLSELSEYLGWLFAAGFASQCLQAFGVYPVLYFLFTRKNPCRYLGNIFPAIATAFSTASSAATFPLTFECAVEKNKIHPGTANFVLPLGVTINMDGTSMTLIVSVFWLAYAQGQTLDFAKVLLMILTATVSSVGTAPIPSASIIYTGTIAEVAGVPLGNLFGVIVAVDWLRDRVRTCVNVMGDSVAVGIIDHLYTIENKETPEIDSEEVLEIKIEDMPETIEKKNADSNDGVDATV